jgi:hypothetical protein
VEIAKEKSKKEEEERRIERERLEAEQRACRFDSNVIGLKQQPKNILYFFQLLYFIWSQSFKKTREMIQRRKEILRNPGLFAIGICHPPPPPKKQSEWPAVSTLYSCCEACRL